MNLKRRRWLVPEVVQTSAMDCGPAALKCLLEGFGTPVSYGRLREACQTDVDGTSIDTMEEIAVQLGLEAEQIMVPPDYVLLEETNALPAITVVALPTGMTHFVLVWRKHGPLVQAMDPAAGRRWLSHERLLSSLHLHTQLAPLVDWKEWATSEKFLRPLRQKLSDLGCSNNQTSRLTEQAAASNDWRPLATLEASTRTVEALVFTRSLRHGSEAGNLVEKLFADSLATDDHSKASLIPSHFWSVKEAPSAEDGIPQIYFRGAVLVHASGRRQEPARKFVTMPGEENTDAAVSPEISAALEQPQAEPYVELVRLLKADGVLAPACITAALLAASIGVMIEALLFRGLLDLAHKLGAPVQRVVMVGAALLFVAGMLMLEFPVGLGAAANRTKAGGSIADRLPRENSPPWRSLFSQPAQLRHGRAIPSNPPHSASSRIRRRTCALNVRVAVHGCRRDLARPRCRAAGLRVRDSLRWYQPGHAASACRARHAGAES